VTRRYEIVYILDSALDETQINEALDRHHARLKSADNQDPVKNVNHWGKRTLAYPIRKATVGHYAVVDFHADPTVLPEFERAIKLDESIIRYLMVLNEGEVPRPITHPDDRKESPRGNETGSGPGARPKGGRADSKEDNE
jgi:small subunit ribosomal protein S6